MWIREGNFDVLHIHEPLAPSLSVLACWAARGPIVATWHSSYERSKMLLTLNKLAITAMEKISARIAVSEAARTTLVEHVGGDAVIIPNGVDMSEFAQAHALPGWPGDGHSLVFLGRVDEPRKGLSVLLAALPQVLQKYPHLRLLVAGPGDLAEALADVPEEVCSHVVGLGRISATDKPNVLASGDIYVAPNTGGESFGIVLLEAMAAGTPVLASDLLAFKRVLADGKAGATFANEDAPDCARAIIELLDNKTRREELRANGYERANEFDWAKVSKRIVTVYESVTSGGTKVQTDLVGQMFGKLGNLRIKRSVSRV
jgi:phosphatidylinositol alpha-mannosyltransferase